ncbi:MerR family transcriptional regulator [Nocardiopsis aegyptia]|uniref:DNA-binding transcriptional MerR regulator n=1 Tax=Nocardiopsis aegyptia TaxID=220378 RepID=A0A7Z0EIU0_9ACTN|nr:helix-turn-helix domain-containing protein [Nocardiopsis aegyptia]NYJ32757.1 DNA-binding transcriptional MerR regulator [Nocardiopsis aegyptia]
MSETDARLSIGEFSRVTWLSPKALRLYERRGLLRPDVVDAYTGYRYYRPSQAERARMIALLRRVGMPLERIGAVLDAAGDERRALLDAYRTDVVRAHERAVALLDGLARGLLDDRPERGEGGPGRDAPGEDARSVDALGENPRTADAPGEDGPEVSSRDVPERHFVARTVRTTVADLPSHIERAAAELSQRAGAAADRSAPLVVVYHGEVGWESDGPVEVRVPVTGASGADGVEPAGSELFVDVPYGEVQFPTILRAFDAVRAAAARHARRPSGSPREIYLDGDPFRCQVAQRYVRTQG